MKKRIFSLMLMEIVISSVIVGCKENVSNNVPTQQAGANQQNIRSDIKANIDRLKDYDIINIEHMTEGIEKPQKYEPESPKEFNAGMFKITFQKVQQTDNLTSIDQVSVVCQTESKVGHLAKVVPGKTVVDGFIFYAGNANLEDIPKLINDKLKFTKDEEKYFIEHLYGRFAKKMTQSQAKFLNEIKDFSLAIYFNGNKGIEQYFSSSFKSKRIY